MRIVAALLAMVFTWLPCRASELTIGLIPEQNVFQQLERYEPVGAYLSERTGVPIRFRILPRYGNIIESFRSEGLDGAFWGSFTGALAIHKVGTEPVARPVWKDGSSTYWGYLFVRKDSGIRSVADMKGRTAVFVDKATTAGYIFPVAYLRANGVDRVEEFFREFYFSGSHDAAITAVLEGKADVGAAKNTIYDKLASTDPRIREELVILATSEEVPSNGLGLRQGLPETMRQALSAALLGMSSDPEGRRVLEAFGAREFVKTTREDYAPVFDLARQAGIDLATYDYINE